jgi:hypothetical protein
VAYSFGKIRRTMIPRKFNFPDFEQVVEIKSEQFSAIIKLAFTFDHEVISLSAANPVLPGKGERCLYHQ